MTAYLADIEYQGGNFVGGTQVTSVELKRNRFVLQSRVQGENVHGIAGLVQLFGIESPGLTSSMAIADYVADLVNV